MAKSDNRKRGEKPEPPRWSNEVIGIVLICAGLLAFLSVISYTPKDLNDIGFLEGFASKRGAAEQTHNFIGRIGAVLGFAQAALFGAGGYIVPLALIWLGVVKLVFDGRLWPRIIIGFTVLALSGAAFWQVWRNLDTVDLTTHAGGLLGWLLGGKVFLPLLNQTGSLIVLLTVHVIAVILLTGQPPVKFLKGCHILMLRQIAKFRERREAGEMQAAKVDLRNSERNMEREQRRKERESGKTAAVAATAAAAANPQQELGLRETPKPQIFDASQRKTESPKPGDKPFERKPKAEGHLSLSTAGFENYDLPGFDLLDPDTGEEAPEANRDELFATQRIIVETLRAFGIEVTPGDITRGPTITRYEIYPSTGLRVSRISQLEADLARATCAERINILAPIPGKDTVGIELANSQKVSVPLRELLQDPEFRSAKKKIPLALGKDVYGKTVIGDLAAMPHLLVAGATGSGKSVCINSIIASMLFKFGPDELRFIMVDPKVVEMQMYNKLPHLVVPVVTDPKKVVAALKWVVNEMEKRYRVFAKTGVRNFDAFNQRVRPEKVEPVEEEAPPWNADNEVSMEEIESIALALESGELGGEAEEDELPIEEDKIPDRYPYIVVLIDELADLMQTAPADVEMCIARIAQKARAAGIHLIIATQTPRADVVTGIIKANIPCRIAFQVSSALDSRVILDTKGADKLVGKGDMLYLPPGSAKLERSQGAFVSDEEVERLVMHCAAQASPNFESDIVRSINSGGGDEDDEEEVSAADEDLIMKCIDVARQEQKCSTSLLQRRLRLGYTRAARMVDILEARGVVGPGDGAKPREVYLK
ncbi:DNA translocase FtsK 4TM domain-containing protein [Luteolibacter sp. Populi]|uniref:FtsK/SpoIIIE family DNA translocase n=1 Tax=Luteolibacter sp. Populi TaxID=3230487 RepID=UPI003465C2A7